MKKLALALVCFASVAFMASCVKPVDNPEPSLAVMTGENYVYDGQTIDVDTEYTIGFRAASNNQTKKDLSTFKLAVKILELDGTEVDSADTLMNISGTEFVYEHILNFTLTRELVGKAEITATVTDVDGKMNSTIINLNVNQPAVELVASPITWVRRANNVLNAEEMAQNGLQWTGSYRDIMATIEPLTNCKMYLCNGDDFATITTDLQEAAYFNNLVETSRPIEKYREISATLGNQTPNDMLAVIDADGDYHLVLFSTAKAESVTGVGTQITINGQVK